MRGVDKKWHLSSDKCEGILNSIFTTRVFSVWLEVRSIDPRSIRSECRCSAQYRYRCIFKIMARCPHLFLNKIATRGWMKNDWSPVICAEAFSTDLSRAQVTTDAFIIRSVIMASAIIAFINFISRYALHGTENEVSRPPQFLAVPRSSPQFRWLPGLCNGFSFSFATADGCEFRPARAHN